MGQSVPALAFVSLGNRIAFNNGEYDPSSAEGQHVLAHELAHVRQQTGGAVSMLPQAGELEIDPDEWLEREAEKTAQRVMEGGELGIQRLAKTAVHVQRSEKQKRRPNGDFGELKEKYKQFRGDDKPYNRKNRPRYNTPQQEETVWN